MIKTKKGFTLAEVLTTLMVIGVVAAMTIPTLMNSTNDQQLKVAYKKAMSVLGQAVQLMVAKEVECEVQTSAQLASCFANNVLSGSVVDYKNDSSNNEDLLLNVVTTADGMAYQFIFLDHDNPPATPRTLDEICGDTSLWSANIPDADLYKGKNAKCAVIVDVNGFSKGTKEFANNGNRQEIDNVLDGIAAREAQGNNAAVEARGHGTDQLPIYLTGTGVRPIYDNTKAKGVGINKGYAYMYGDDAQPVDNANNG